MAALEKFGPDISKDAEWIAKTDHAVEAAHKFDWDHVLRGEIKRGDSKGLRAYDKLVRCRALRDETGTVHPALDIFAKSKSKIVLRDNKFSRSL